jgi:hypothetical protein
MPKRCLNLKKMSGEYVLAPVSVDKILRGKERLDGRKEKLVCT